MRVLPFAYMLAGWARWLAAIAALAISLPAHAELKAWVRTADAIVSGSSRFIVGEFKHRLKLGDRDYVSAGSIDAFVVRLNSRGGVAWSNTFSSPGVDYAAALALAPNGDVIVGGRLGTGAEAAGLPIARRDSEGFVVRYGADGVHKWSQRFAPRGSAKVAHVAVDANGDVLIAGGFSAAELVLGATTLKNSHPLTVPKPRPADAPGLGSGMGGPGTGSSVPYYLADVFVAKLRGTDGTPLWSRSFGGEESSWLSDLATDLEGPL